MDLSNQQIDLLKTQGFLRMDSIVPKHEMEPLRQIYDRLFSSRAGFDEGLQFDLAGDEESGKLKVPQIIQPSKLEPALRDMELVSRARAIAEAVLGGEIESDYGEHMIFKAPHANTDTPWHQDQAYHAPDVYHHSVNFWIPLDDATVENGCMHFVSESHQKDILPHHSIGHDPKVHGLEVDTPERFVQNQVACPVPAGGCALHLPHMLHYAGGNNTDRPRRAYILMMNIKSSPREKPLNNYWITEKTTARQQRETISSK